MTGQRIQLAAIIALAALAIAEGRTIIVENTEIFGSELAGWYVIALGCLLTILGIAYYVREKNIVITEDDQAETANNNRKVAQFYPLMIAYAVGIEYLGYIISTLLFFTIFLRFFGKYNWKKVAILSIAISIGFGVVFEQVGMSLPKGLLSFL